MCIRDRSTANQHPETDFTLSVAQQVQADVMDMGGGAVVGAAGDGDLELARQVGKFRVEGRPLANDFAAVSYTHLDVYKRQVITRAVGSADELRIDEVDHPLRAGDMFLLCSDGLNKTVSDEEIARLLAHSDHNCQEAVKAFIHLALMRDASDNVSTVVVNISEGAEAPTEIAEDPGSETLANPIPPDWYLQ